MSYLVVGPQYRGKFDAQKAKELGVMGPNRGRLAKGETITIQVKEGDELVERTIKPEDVLGPSDPPAVCVAIVQQNLTDILSQAFLILDVPSQAHIPALQSSFKNSDFYRQFWSVDCEGSQKSDTTLRGIYHLCGENVLDNEGYKSFLKGFGSDVDVRTHPITLDQLAN